MQRTLPDALTKKQEGQRRLKRSFKELSEDTRKTQTSRPIEPSTKLLAVDETWSQQIQQGCNQFMNFDMMEDDFDEDDGLEENWSKCVEAKRNRTYIKAARRLPEDFVRGWPEATWVVPPMSNDTVFNSAQFERAVSSKMKFGEQICRLRIEVNGNERYSHKDEELMEDESFSF